MPEISLEEAQEVHDKLLIVDGHNDTPVERVHRGEKPIRWEQRDPAYHMDIPRMKEGGFNAGFFIVGNGPTANVRVTIEQTLASIERYPDDLLLVQSSKDVESTKDSGKIGILMTIEGAGRWLEGEVDILRLYDRLGVDEPVVADWAADADLPLPFPLRHHQAAGPQSPIATRLARQGFYAQCTYIDHQIRLLIGVLNEEGLLDNTVVMFISDHGDMLGHHGLWSKPPMLEWSAKIPLLLMPTAACERTGHHRTDDRFAELRDVMPTLLDLCDIPIPASVEGLSLVADERRDHLYCEHDEDPRKAMRMMRADNFKLIWYPAGNRTQLFDVAGDPAEMNDLADSADYASVRQRLTQLLIAELYGSDLDLEWLRDGELVGVPEPEHLEQPNRGLSGQRGWR